MLKHMDLETALISAKNGFDLDPFHITVKKPSRHIEDLLDISDLAMKTDLLCATALHMAAIHACDGLEYVTQRHSRTETNLSSCSSKSI
ncbi:hypothetical protein Bca4012_042752 [Brassica carinata]|nr:unnamed protein product [Brassica napus]